MEEAVNRYYENPNKYSEAQAPVASNPVKDNNPPQKQVDAPPVYFPSPSIMSGQRRRPHTNAVINAGLVRARDEVGLFLP
jgi:hypothetical protein